MNDLNMAAEINEILRQGETGDLDYRQVAVAVNALTVVVAFHMHLAARGDCRKAAEFLNDIFVPAVEQSLAQVEEMERKAK